MVQGWIRGSGRDFLKTNRRNIFIWHHTIIHKIFNKGSLHNIMYLFNKTLGVTLIFLTISQKQIREPLSTSI